MNNMPQKPAKRIVSKGQYIRTLTGKTLLMLLGIAACLVFVQVTINMVRIVSTVPDDIPRFPVFMLALFPLAIGLPCGFWSVSRLIRAAKQMDTGRPLTRANTTDLPAPDSLVRASGEPAQAQQAVLLRPSVEIQERCEEQLLRAWAGE